MSMELFHRNMAFTLHHADQLPLVTMGKATVEKMEGDAYRVRVDVTNDRVIPTIMVKAANTNIVPPDVLTLGGRTPASSRRVWCSTSSSPWEMTVHT